MAKKFSISDTIDVVTATTENFEKTLSVPEREKIEKIPLSCLEAYPDNERIYGKDEQRIIELSEDIKDNGLLTPLIVVKQGNKYVICSGITRFYACQLINYDPVDVIIRDYDDFTLRKVLIASNNNRERPTIIQANEIEYLKNLYEEYSKTYPNYLQGKSITQQIADDLDLSLSTVQRASRLNDLSEKLKIAVSNSHVSATAAQRLAKVDNDIQDEIASMLTDETESLNKEDAKLIVDTDKKYTKEITVLKKNLKGKNDTEKENILKNISSLEDNKRNDIIEIVRKKPKFEVHRASIEKTKEKLLDQFRSALQLDNASYSDEVYQVINALKDELAEL